MLRKTSFILISFILIHFLYSKDFIYYDYASLKDMFSPRDEGSKKEKELVEYIEDFCKKNNLEYKIEKINNEKDIITNSYNIEVNIKGSSLEHEKLIVVCPLNTAIIFQKSYDNSISIQILLELIKSCLENPFNKDITFLFSGANERENSEFLGIKYFLEKNDYLSRSFVTVIDILSNKRDIRFYGSVNRKPIPLEILRQYLKIKKKSDLINIYFNKDEIYKSKFYLLPENNYTDAFLEREIQCVIFSNKEKTHPNDTFLYNEEYLRQLTDFFFKWLVSFDKIKFPIDADYHYQYINLFGIKIIVSESFQILLFLILIFIVIFTRLHFPRFQRLHYYLLIKGIPYFLIIFVIFLLSSFIPLLLFIPVDYYTGFSKAVFNYPVLYFINIFILPLIIILLLYEIIEKLPFPKHSYLYVYGAFIFSGINLVIFTLFDISISFIYLWSLVTITASHYTGKNYKLKFLLYFLSVLPLIMLVIDITYLRNIEIIKKINPILLNLLFSIFTFPFFLLSLRVELLLRARYTRIIRLIKRKKFIQLLASFILFPLLLLAILSALYKPSQETIEARLITNIKDNNSHLLIESERNIKSIFINNGNTLNEYYFKSNNVFFPVIFIPPPYEIDYERIEDDYFNFNMKAKSIFPIEYLSIYLVAPTGHYPLESNYNFERIYDFDYPYNPEKEEIYKFNIPRNIGKSFLFKMSILDQSYKLIVTIEYPFINLGGVYIKKTGAIISKRSIFVDEIIIEPGN